MEGVVDEVNRPKIADKGKVAFSTKFNGLPGNSKFVVTQRDTKGMAGSQDKFSMWVVNGQGEVEQDLGSHVSVNSAKKFAKNKGMISEEQQGYVSLEHQIRNIMAGKQQ